MDRRPAHHGRARGERAHGVGHLAGVAGGDLDVLEPHAEGVGDDLRERGLVALALRGEAGRDLDLAGGLDVDVGALVGADAGALDVAGEADADPCGPAAAISARKSSNSSQPTSALSFASEAG